MNAAWSAREDHTSETTKVPSSAVPAACESSSAGQFPWAGLHVDAKVLADGGVVGLGQAWELKDQRFGHRNSPTVVSRERPRVAPP